MKTSFKSRATALAVSVLVTFGTLKTIVDHAHPVAPAVQLASATR